MNKLSNGATIIVVDTNEKFHTLEDWELAIGNNDYIGTPELQKELISIRGRNGVLDISEALTGHQNYTSREISITLGGIRSPEHWDYVISTLRNKINGRIIKLIFDNDPKFYWQGRCEISGFDRMRSLGTFELTIPNADPYKYTVQAFNEDWVWDPFSFTEESVTTMKKTHTITSETKIIIPKGYRPVVPVIEVYSIATYLTVRKNENGRIINLKMGENEIPQIMVNGSEETTLIFNGSGEFAVNFRGASL